MSTLLQKYQHHILNKPVRTFAMQSSFMMTLGDIISQQAIEKRGFDNHDVGRSFRIYCYAFALGGPVMGTWFAFINRTITIKNNLAATMVKVGLDQVFFAPTILALFMGGISVLEGRNLTEIKQKFENSYYNGLMNSYRYWPFVNMFTFAIIPVHYRPIVGSCFGIGWNSYLSHMNQKSGNALHSTQHTHTAAATSSLAATTTKLSS